MIKLSYPYICVEQVMMVREWAKERAQWTMAKVWRDGQQYKWQETSSSKGREWKWDLSGLRWSAECTRTYEKCRRKAC